MKWLALIFVLVATAAVAGDTSHCKYPDAIQPYGIDANGCPIVERAVKRDPKVPQAYLKSIGLTKTPKGCQVDHIKPLKCGGPDTVENVQLICGASLKMKEKMEHSSCEVFAEWGKQCLAK